jgi:capsular polysaccharide biosynthesis protein
MGLEEFLDALRRHKRIPIIVLILTIIAIAFVVTNHEDPKPKYTSSVQVQITDISSQNSQQLLLSLVQNQDGTTSPVLSDQVFNAADVEAGSAKITTVVTLPDRETGATGSVDITVVADNPVFAYDTAKALSDAYVQIRTANHDKQLQDNITTLTNRVSDIDGLLAGSLQAINDVQAQKGAQQLLNPADVNATDPTTGKFLYEIDPAARQTVASQLTLKQNAQDELYQAVIDQRSQLGVAPDSAVGPTPAIESSDKDDLAVLIPVLALIAVALIVGIGGALFLAKLDHTLGEPADAAHALRAPVLGTVARRRRAERSPVALDPKAGARMRQFRSLAATVDSMGTIPKRIFITSPGSSPEIARVGTNLAVCLAELGHSVVLVATDPNQLFALGNLAPAQAEGYAELIEQAKSGFVNGQVPHSLLAAPGLPTLWVLPPGTFRAHVQPRAVASLLSAIEGGLADGSQPDVCIVLGSSLLDDADAAVLARESGHVLWVVETGATAEEAAAVAQQRLALTGVDPIGVAVVVGTGV